MIEIETATGCDTPVLLIWVPFLILRQEALLYFWKNILDYYLKQLTILFFKKMPPAAEDSLFMSDMEKLPFEAGGTILFISEL